MNDLLDRVTAYLPGWSVDVTQALIIGGVAIGIALLVHRFAFRLLARVAEASESEVDDLVQAKLARPTRYALVALAIVIAARETPALASVWEKIAGFVMPALVGWIILALLHAFVGAMEMRTDISVADNCVARRKRTRLTIFSRIASFIVVFVTIGLMLLSIPGVRDIGVTLMASAGLAGLAVGAAAQPALKSLIAGLQMALTEPISIDDVVIIDGEWGRIEDIRTTYVIVKIWDERRLVVPTTKFLEETFQNWTKKGSALLGTTFLYLDPMTDVGPIRAEFERTLKENALWDGRVCKLQVTNATAEAVEIRLLMSASDASNAFDLRCEIREHMLAWLRVNQPEAAMKRRVETTAQAEAAQAEAASIGD